jgi:hypothetical protein
MNAVTTNGLDEALRPLRFKSFDLRSLRQGPRKRSLLMPVGPGRKCLAFLTLGHRGREKCSPAPPPGPVARRLGLTPEARMMPALATRDPRLKSPGHGGPWPDSGAEGTFQYPPAHHGSGELHYLNGIPVLTVECTEEEIGAQICMLALDGDMISNEDDSQTLAPDPRSTNLKHNPSPVDRIGSEQHHDFLGLFNLSPYFRDFSLNATATEPPVPPKFGVTHAACGTRNDENGYDDSGGDVSCTSISGLDASSTSWPGTDAPQGHQSSLGSPSWPGERGLFAPQAISPH